MRRWLPPKGYHLTSIAVIGGEFDQSEKQGSSKQVLAYQKGHALKSCICPDKKCKVPDLILHLFYFHCFNSVTISEGPCSI